MSDKTTWPCKRGRRKIILKKYDVILGYTWDVLHGKGWFCRVYPYGYDVIFRCYGVLFHKKDGFAFHKNKFTAVRNAIKDTNE